MEATVHVDEFDNDCKEIAVWAIPGESRQIRQRVFTIEGLMLLCMFSEQPIAKRFRHWLKKIGRKAESMAIFASYALRGLYNEPLAPDSYLPVTIVSTTH